MVAYLVNQIILGNLTYRQIVTAKPELKAKSDAYIDEKELPIDKTA